MSEIAFERLKYVAVEIIKKTSDNVKDVECGLFMGLCERLDSKKSPINFIIIKPADSIAKLYNIREFNILTIDILSNNTRYMTVFTNLDKDQHAAKNMLIAAKDQLAEENRMYLSDVKEELIDVRTYESYPANILNSNDLSSIKTVNVNSTEKRSIIHSPVTTVEETEKKEPAVLQLTRKGKLPSPAKLKQMREQVLVIMTNAFVIGQIPVLECDLEESG